MSAPDHTAPDRVVVNVAGLPHTVFGHRAVTWWATAGFILVEGTTLGIVATAYLYLRLNAAEWPPRPASDPRLLVPTINLLVILGTIWPMWRAERAAQGFEGRRAARWLVVALLFEIAATVLRWYELRALNVRWDTNAYGSALWAVYAAHTLLLVTDVLETAVLALMFVIGRYEDKHYSDVEDASMYQQFLSLAWLVLYVLVILGPRML